MYEMKTYIKKRADVLIPIGIFLLGLSIRLIFAINSNDILSGDEIFYESSGRGLYLGEGYMAGGRLTSSIMPGYSAFVAFIYHIFQDKLIFVRIAQAIIDALMCLAVYAIAKRLFNKKIGILAAFLCTVHYFFLKSLQLLRPDTIQIFFIIASILFWIRWNEKFTKRDASLFGFFSSLAIICKPNVFFIPFILLLIGFIRLLKKREKVFKAFIIGTTISILIIILPMSIWTWRNYRVHKAFIPFTTGFGAVLYHSYNPVEGKKFGIIPRDEITAKANKLESEVERNRYLVDKAMRHIIEHPYEAIKLIPLKILFFWSVFDWETLGTTGKYNFSTAFILPFSILGLFFSRKSFKRLMPIILPIIYFFLLSIVLSGLPRFRLPIEPFLIIFAAYSMVHLYDTFSKNKVVFLAVSWFCLNFYMFTISSRVLGIGKFLMKSLRLW